MSFLSYVAPPSCCYYPNHYVRQWDREVGYLFGMAKGIEILKNRLGFDSLIVKYLGFHPSIKNGPIYTFTASLIRFPLTIAMKRFFLKQEEAESLLVVRDYRNAFRLKNGLVDSGRAMRFMQARYFLETALTYLIVSFGFFRTSLSLSSFGLYLLHRVQMEVALLCLTPVFLSVTAFVEWCLSPHHLRQNDPLKTALKELAQGQSSLEFANDLYCTSLKGGNSQFKEVAFHLTHHLFPCEWDTYEVARELYNKSLAIEKQNPQRAFFLAMQGYHMLDEILSHYRKEGRCEKMTVNDRPKSHYKDIADLAYRAGKCATLRQDYSIAISYKKEAIDFLRILNYTKSLSKCLESVGQDYDQLVAMDEETQDYSNAITWQIKNVQLQQKCRGHLLGMEEQSRKRMFLAFHTLSRLYVKNKQPKEAIYLMQRLIKEYTDLDSIEELKKKMFQDISKSLYGSKEEGSLREYLDKVSSKDERNTSKE